MCLFLRPGSAVINFCPKKEFVSAYTCAVCERNRTCPEPSSKFKAQSPKEVPGSKCQVPKPAGSSSLHISRQDERFSLAPRFSPNAFRKFNTKEPSNARTSGSAIPTGLCRPAQGCEERAVREANHRGCCSVFPWVAVRKVSNPNGVASGFHRLAATPLGLFSRLPRCPRVARSSQPWALGRNPLGIQVSQRHWL